MLTRLLFVIIAAAVMLGSGLPMWTEGRALIHFAKIIIKYLIKFNKHVLSSNPAWSQT